jgi:hypothetical protein
VENPRQPGNWLQTVSADSISLEFSGSFAITDLALVCESAGSWNQFAVPPRKKFSSYINSVPYPISVADSVSTGIAPIGEGDLHLSLVSLDFDDALGVVGGAVGEGDLHTSIINHLVYDIDGISVSPTTIYGALVVSLIAHTVYDIDSMSVEAAPTAGTLVVSLIAHTVYDIDSIDISPSTIAGTLV